MITYTRKKDFLYFCLLSSGVLLFSGCSTSKLNMDQDRLGLLKSTGRKSDLPGTILHQQEEPVSCKQLESLDAIGQEQKAAEVAALYKQLAEPETNYQNQEKGEKAFEDIFNQVVKEVSLQSQDEDEKVVVDLFNQLIKASDDLPNQDKVEKEDLEFLVNQLFQEAFRLQNQKEIEVQS